MTDAQIVQRAHRDYLESQILSAHPVEVVHMLYRVAVDNVTAAIAHLKSGDAFARASAVTKAEIAVDELLLALDHSVGAPFTRTLASLYHYVLEQIIQGHAKKSEKAFQEALSVLNSLSATWAEVKAKELGTPASTASAVVEETPEPVAQPQVSDPGAAYRYGQPPAAELSRDWSC